MADSGNEIAIGDLVLLKDLTKANHLNDRQGVVVSDLSSDGRFSVNLFIPCMGGSQRKEVSVKPVNLMKVEKTACSNRFNDGRSQCNNCHNFFPCSDLKDCSRCKLVSYCGEACQRQHWKKEHKQECEALRRGRKGAGDTSRHLKSEEKASVFLTVAERLSRKGKLAEAEKMVRDSIEASALLSAYSLLSHILAAQDRMDEAMETMKEALRVFEANAVAFGDEEVAPMRSTLYQNWYLLLAQQGDYEQAIEVCRKVLQLDHPTTITVWLRLGSLYYKRGRLSVAGPAYEKFLQEVGDDIDNLKKNWKPEALEAISYITLIVLAGTRQFFRNPMLYQPFPVDLIQSESTKAINLLQKAILVDPTFEELAKERMTELQELIDRAESMRSA